MSTKVEIFSIHNRWRSLTEFDPGETLEVKNYPVEGDVELVLVKCEVDNSLTRISKFVLDDEIVDENSITDEDLENAEIIDKIPLGKAHYITLHPTQNSRGLLYKFSHL